MGSVRDRRLAAVIEQATVDCYNESEQVTGFFTMLEDNLVVPFGIQVHGCGGDDRVGRPDRGRADRGDLFTG
jgi:hypothetical protein